MVSVQRSVKSGHEGGDPRMDEMKKLKKKAWNREYGRQSRIRKKKQLEDLTNESNKLQSANKKLAESIKAKEKACAEIEVANNILKAIAVELADRLHFLNSIIVDAEEVNWLFA